MSVSKLRAQLKSKSDKELIDEIVDLYKKHDSVKLHYKALRDPLINPPVHSHLLRAAQLEPWP
uniref:hypothetical protein n=1 Tax=Vibrio vulnificus TaxID=672 RepID=UPI000D4D084B